METISVHHKENYAILELSRGKVNPINLQMMREIIGALNDLMEDDSVRGVIISGQPGYFSVGLDVKELASLNQEQSEEFFNTFGRMIFELVQFPKPMISAITGHSPAGGCIIAICSDYRVMATGEHYRIGLNEVPVGIMVPPHVHELYAFWVGQGKAYQYLLEGKLHTGEEAMANGLIDELVDLGDVLHQAEAKLRLWLKADEHTLMGVKINLRHHLLKRMIAMAKDTPVDTHRHFWRPSSQERLRQVLDQVGK